jgi:ABC-type nitrate/sulfonate/bicarbonate transport system substrate-binding protein
VQGLVSGSLHVASITTDSAILAELASPSIGIVQAITRNMPLSLVTQSSIKTPADCKGKVFGASNTNTADAYIIIKMLEGYGLKVGQDFTIIAAGNPAARTAALQSGQIAGIAVVEPNIAQLVALGYNNLISGPDVKTFQHWPHIALMANNSWASKNAAVLQNYIKATLDGVRITLDPKRKKQVVAAFASATGADATAVAAAYRDWVVKVKPWSTTGEMPSSGLQLVIQSLIDTNGLTAPGPNPANLINSTYVHAAIKQPFLTKL